MANSFTLSNQTVCGSWRVYQGTLTMGDSSTGLIVPTGMNRVIFACDNSTVQAHISHTAGGIIATTATSGATFDVIIFGQ